MQITIPVPNPVENGSTGNNNPPDNGDSEMAASIHTERYDDLTLQIAMARKEAADLYADDARRAFQRRIDEMSIQEALAQQTATTSKVAQDAMQLNTGVKVPVVAGAA